MACNYCSAPKTIDSMSRETAFKVVDMAADHATRQSLRNVCLSFFGGEPLLRKKLVFDTIDYSSRVAHEKDVSFTYRLTTNGTMVDNHFVERCRAVGLQLALSIDGTKEAHDKHRRFRNGSPTFDAVSRAGKTILQELPDALAMLTLNEDTVPLLFDSVGFLHAFGFKQVAIALNYASSWSEAGLDDLRLQYGHLAKWYGEVLLSGGEFSLPLFDSKFINLVTPAIDEGRCVPGRRQFSVAADGSIYPCTQYVGLSTYYLGNANNGAGPDQLKLAELAAEHLGEIPSCEGCAINQRCNHTCGCKNLASTGHARRVSPLICTHERMLVDITDRLGEVIFEAVW